MNCQVVLVAIVKRGHDDLWLPQTHILWSADALGGFLGLYLARKPNGVGFVGLGLGLIARSTDSALVFAIRVT